MIQKNYFCCLYHKSHSQLKLIDLHNASRTLYTKLDAEYDQQVIGQLLTALSHVDNRAMMATCLWHLTMVNVPWSNFSKSRLQSLGKVSSEIHLFLEIPPPVPLSPLRSRNPLIVDKGSGGALMQVRAEPGRQTYFGAF